jgi:hypothetical protein
MGLLDYFTTRHLQAKRMRAETELLEARTALSASFVDPRDAFVDPETGEVWRALGGGFADWLLPDVLATEEDLARARKQCRYAAMTNEFAINGHENRVSYIVGSGHVYSVQPKGGEEPSEEKLLAAQAVVDEFVKTNKWHKRQQEIVRRVDRDGECFLRFFPDEEHGLRVRFVEPDEIGRPDTDTREEASFGILTDPQDVETVRAYLLADGTGGYRPDEIQHRKWGRDFNVKRGIPLFYPVRTNLSRAEKLLRNMSSVAEIQAAVAMVRKHEAAGTSVESFVQNQADVSVANATTGETSYHRRYGPGTILDAAAGIEYEFPSHGIAADKFVLVLQAELRAFASRLVMPEFMLTSDASNANYSSTMVAEGPAVKFFSRLQWDMIEDDLEIFERVLDWAVASGRLDEATRAAVEIDVEPPRLESRNRKEEVEADVTLVRERVMSKHTAAIRHELDPDFESGKMEQEREQSDPYGGMGEFGQVPGQNGPPRPNQQDDEDE